MTALTFARKTIVRRTRRGAIVVAIVALVGTLEFILLVLGRHPFIASLPYKGPDRLVALSEFDRQSGTALGTISEERFAAARQASTTFESVAAVDGPRDVTFGQDVAPISVYSVTASFLETLGVKPALGRNFTEAEANGSAGSVCILSDALWRRLGASRQIYGQNVLVDGTSRVVIGVLPASFRFPSPPEERPPGLLMPLSDATLAQAQRLSFPIARLLPGVTTHQAAAVLSTPATSVSVVALREWLFSSVHDTVLWIIMAGVLAAMLLCANLSTVFIADYLSREHDFAVLTAVGATRFSVVRILIAESVTLCGVGTLAGLFLARAALLLLRANAPPVLLSLTDDGIGLRIVGIALISVLVCAVIAALGPIAHVYGRHSPNGLWHAAGIFTKGRAKTHRLAGGLIAVQLILAIPLVADAFALAKTVHNLSAVAFGFDPHRVVLVQPVFPKSGYATVTARGTFVDQLQQSLGGTEGIESISSSVGAPLLTRPSRTLTLSESSKDAVGGVWAVSCKFFDTLRIHPVAGRMFNEDECRMNAPVAILTESGVHAANGSKGIVGGTVQSVNDVPRVVVGVVPDIRRSVRTPGGADMFIPIDVTASKGLIVSVRVAHSTDIPKIITAGKRVSKEVRLLVTPLEAYVESQTVRERLQSRAFGVFALVTATLACLGIYGMMAHRIVTKKREIGICLALGASSSGVLARFVADAMMPVVSAILPGLLFAYLVLGELGPLMFGQPPHDVGVLLATVIVLVVCAAAAAIMPTLTAVGQDPSVLLRTE